MKKIINPSHFLSIILPVIIIIVSFTSSCSKVDDLLPSVSNESNITGIGAEDTTINNNTNTIEHLPNENLIICDNENLQNILEGTKWKVTYNSFYLNNKYPICPMPYDTLIFNEWYNMGEVFFSNTGDGYFETHTYLVDCAPYYLADGTAEYAPFLNYWSADPNSLIIQEIENYIYENNRIIIEVPPTSTGWEYTITFDIIEHTNHKIILENRNNRFIKPYIDWSRDVRLEMEKITK